MIRRTFGNFLLLIWHLSYSFFKKQVGQEALVYLEDRQARDTVLAEIIPLKQLNNVYLSSVCYQISILGTPPICTCFKSWEANFHEQAMAQIRRVVSP